MREEIIKEALEVYEQTGHYPELKRKLLSLPTQSPSLTDEEIENEAIKRSNEYGFKYIKDAQLFQETWEKSAKFYRDKLKSPSLVSEEIENILKKNISFRSNIQNGNFGCVGIPYGDALKAMKELSTLLVKEGEKDSEDWISVSDVLKKLEHEYKTCNNNRAQTGLYRAIQIFKQEQQKTGNNENRI